MPRYNDEHKIKVVEQLEQGRTLTEVLKVPRATEESPDQGRNNLAHSTNLGADAKESATKPSKQYFVRLGRPRPSQIMRRMDRLMHLRWLEKIRPAKAAKQKWDEAMDQLNAAHGDAVKTATSTQTKS